MQWYQSMGFISFLAFISFPLPPLLLGVIILINSRKKKLKVLEERYALFESNQQDVNEILSRKNIIEKEIESSKKELINLQEDILFEYIETNLYDDLTSEEINNELSLLKLDQKELVKNNDALVINIDAKQSIINNLSKKILRCFNTESDQIIYNVTVKNIDASRNKVIKSFEQINKLFEKSGVALTKEYLNSKLEEMNLSYNFVLKKEQEKEIQKAIKEQMIEEEKVRKEIETEKKKLEKEEKQFKGEVEKLMAYLKKSDSEVEKNLYADKIKELEEKINLLEKDKENILNREQNTRAGFVYIISNVGSFGENIYKIGMTRRLEPMDRVKELSSASVPFSFDVHAMIFSEDAPALETELHKTFRKYEVNKVNPRKEFFNVSLDKIEHVVKDKYSETVDFIKAHKSSEYLESLNVNKQI